MIAGAAGADPMLGLGTELFEAAGAVATPLYTEDPRQMPFINGEQQYESRWVVSAVLELDEEELLELVLHSQQRHLLSLLCHQIVVVQLCNCRDKQQVP